MKNIGEPLYLSAPYEDKPWFYVEQDPKTHPCALPYYRAVKVEGGWQLPVPCYGCGDAELYGPDLYSGSQMIEFAKAYAAQAISELEASGEKSTND